MLSLQWRHKGRDGVSNHQPHHCLLNRLFRRRSGKNQSSASLAFVREIHRWPVNFPHKWPVTWKMFPFDDVIIPWLRNTVRPICSLWYNIRVSGTNMFTNLCLYQNYGWLWCVNLMRQYVSLCSHYSPAICTKYYVEMMLCLNLLSSRLCTHCTCTCFLNSLSLLSLIQGP